MSSEIDLVSDGEGLTVIGNPAASGSLRQWCLRSGRLQLAAGHGEGHAS